jgi:hypothetical protein
VGARSDQLSGRLLAANNCVPGTKGCFNVPTKQQQCLASYNNSAIGKTIQFFSLYHLATDFGNALPEWTLLPGIKIALAKTAKWVSQRIGGTEFLSLTSTSDTVIPSATSAVVDLAETVGKDAAVPVIVLATATDLAMNQACSETFVPMAPVAVP